MGKFNHETCGSATYYSEYEAEDEYLIKDNNDFASARKSYMGKIEELAKMLKHQRNMKKIKKECMKNMIAGPSLIDSSTKTAL